MSDLECKFDACTCEGCKYGTCDAKQCSNGLIIVEIFDVEVEVEVEDSFLISIPIPLLLFLDFLCITDCLALSLFSVFDRLVEIFFPHVRACI